MKSWKATEGSGINPVMQLDCWDFKSGLFAHTSSKDSVQVWQHTLVLALKQSDQRRPSRSCNQRLSEFQHRLSEIWDDRLKVTAAANYINKTNRSNADDIFLHTVNIYV